MDNLHGTFRRRRNPPRRRLRGSGEVDLVFDTRLRLYADDADAGDKTRIARELLRNAMVNRTGVVSTQVLQDFYVNARRKLQLDGAAARARIEVYLGFDVVTVTPTLMLAAVDLNRLDSVSFWYALVIRAAEHAGCDTLLSEDLQAGRRFGSVRIVNPFA